MDKAKVHSWAKIGAISLAAFMLFLTAGYLSARLNDYVAKQNARDLITEQGMEVERESLSNKIITARLHELLQAIPNATLVRVSVIHNGTSMVTKQPLLFADNLFAVSSPGFPIGDMQTNVPLNRWEDYLDDLRAGKCSFRELGKVAAITEGVRWRQLGVRASVICPLTNTQGQLMGAIFLSWHDTVQPPSDKEVPVDVEKVQQAAKDVSIAFEMRLSTR